MLKYEHYEQMIMNVARGINQDRFFEEYFKRFSKYDQARILQLIMNKNFIHFLKGVDSYSSRQLVFDSVKDGFLEFCEERDVDKCLKLTPFLPMYLSLYFSPYHNLNFNRINDFSRYGYMFYKIYELSKRNPAFLDDESVKEALGVYVKTMGQDVEISREIVANKHYEYFEKLLCEYINNIDLNGDLQKEDLLQLIVELQGKLNSIEICNALKKKFSIPIDLSKYYKYIENSIPLKGSLKKQFIRDLIVYRCQKGVLPEDICLYGSSYDCLYDPLIVRMCTVDYLKCYLKKNGISDVAVFCDEMIKIDGNEGMANGDVIVLGNMTLNEVAFHEARHVIQYHKMFEKLGKTEFTGYMYSMTKDLLLRCDSLSWDDYNMYNHSRFLFEIDADIQGFKEYYKFLEKSRGLEEYEKKHCENLDGIEERRISDSKYITISGELKNKFELFDETMSSHLERLVEVPILKVEYNDDGTRKGLVEILKGLEERLATGDINEEETNCIANCIFSDSYRIADAKKELESLSGYSCKRSVIEGLKKKIKERIERSLNDSQNSSLAKKRQ